MTRKPYIESSICTPQSRVGYGCHAVIGNSSNKIYRALSWLSAAASAFVCAVGGPALGVFTELSSRHLFCFCQWSGKYPLPLHFTPYTSATIRERQRTTFALAIFVSEASHKREQSEQLKY
jgi:hypothetical protein